MFNYLPAYLPASHLETTQPEKHEDGKRREPKERRNGCLSQPASCLPTFKTTIENIFLFSSTEGKGLGKMFCVHHCLKGLHSQFPSEFFKKGNASCECGLPCCISTTKRKRCGNKRAATWKGEEQIVSCEYKAGEKEIDEGAQCHFTSATIALFCFHACNEFD